jgi:hypothetical protein
VNLKEMFDVDEVTIVIMGNECLSQTQKNKEKKNNKFPQIW